MPAERLAGLLRGTLVGRERRETGICVVEDGSIRSVYACIHTYG